MTPAPAADERAACGMGPAGSDPHAARLTPVALPDPIFHAVHPPGPFTPERHAGTPCVRVRLATYGALPAAVHVRSEPDNEELLTPMTLLGAAGAWRTWQAWLPLVTHRSATRYAFRCLVGGEQRWLSQSGLHPYPPPLAVHFRHVHGYVPPRWVWHQVVYQVFPDRFRNGDPSSGVASGTYSYAGEPVVARAWHERPQRHQGAREFFGGDLDGVRQALPYLAALGVSTLYLNPVFVSPSSHKYDTMDYEHVDPHLGGDAALERLLDGLRARGMRLVLDAVVNHTSERHPWFDRRSEHGAGGAYEGPDAPHRERYVFTDPDDPESYHGWLGTRTLPVLDFASADVQRSVYAGEEAILRRWLRPPWRIDGWRLDVIHMLGEGPGAVGNHHHVRAIRRAIREERSDAYVLGEHFFEASAWLQGDQEDGAMNYYGFQRPMLAFWAGVDQRGDPLALDAAGLDAWLTDARARIPFALALSQLNLLDSHDVPRFLTRVGGDRRALAAAAHALFGYLGVPSVYYGDEVGLEGDGDPDCRRPFPWDETRWDRTLLATYRRLAHLRRRAPPLACGDVRSLLADGDVHAFARVLDDAAVVVIQHRGDRTRRVRLPLWPTGIAEGWTDAFSHERLAAGDELDLTLQPRSARTLVSDPSWLPGDGPVAT